MADTAKAPATTPLPDLRGLANSALAWRLYSFALVFLIWELASLTGFSIAFPPATAVASAFWQMLVDGEFTTAYADCFPPLLIGLAITVIGGLVMSTALTLVVIPVVYSLLDRKRVVVAPQDDALPGAAT